MNSTETLKMNLPSGNDIVDIEKLNENFEKIDVIAELSPVKQKKEDVTEIDVSGVMPYIRIINKNDIAVNVTDVITEEVINVSGRDEVVIYLSSREIMPIKYTSILPVSYEYFIPASEIKGGGGGGTTDYTDLSNKPQINGNELTGNKTAAQLGLLSGTEKGVANGLAILDEHGKVPSSQLIDYRIYEVASESYAKVYKLQIKPSGSDEWVDVTGGSQINIPKDMVVESGSVKECTEDNVPVSGYKKGDKYIDLVIANKADAHIYINVKDLIDNKAEGIQYNNATSKLTATNVQSAIDEIADSLKNTINPPSEGEVGHVLTVKTVDSSGKPTEWEYTEKGGVGEGGTTNYDDLSNKPAIDGNALTKDSTADTLGLAKKSEIPSIEGLYSKPESGIPSSDMSEGVQESLRKADTALQEHQSLENYVKTNDSRLTDARPSNDVQSYAKTGSGITVAVSVPSNAKFTDTTYSEATTENSGLMTADDKTRLNSTILTPQTAQVGQILAVKAVDSNGKPTEWETIANSASGTSVKVGSSGQKYDPTDGVVTIPAYPTSLPANGGTAANVSGTVAVSHGGTGATTAANARTNLGLGGAATKSVDTSFTGSSTSSSLPTTAAVVTALKNEFATYPYFASTNATLKSGSVNVFGNQIHINCEIACKTNTSAYWGLLNLPFAVKSPAGSGKRYVDPAGWYLDDNGAQILSTKAFNKDETISFDLVLTKYDAKEVLDNVREVQYQSKTSKTYDFTIKRSDASSYYTFLAWHKTGINTATRLYSVFIPATASGTAKIDLLFGEPDNVGLTATFTNTNKVTFTSTSDIYGGLMITG